MTKAAERFLTDVAISWDHRDCYVQTALRGLAEPDAEALASFCVEEHEDYDEAENEVLENIRARVAAVRE